MAAENNVLQFEVKRTGFPVVVGDIELYFDSSLENLRKFLSIDEIVRRKTDELEKLIGTMPNTDSPEALAKDYDKARLIMEAQAEISWDTTFGEGTFKKLYKKYPDLWALNEVFDAVGEAVGKRIQEIGEDRLKSVEEVKEKALAKKASKTKE